MPTQPFFSIITVVYNGEEEIASTIKSLINQDNNNFEFIIIDGNSTDATVPIIKRYKDNIDIMVSEADNGIYDAMNRAIKRAAGQYIFFLNCGDRFCNDQVLSKVKENINNNAEIYYGDIIIEKSSREKKLIKQENKSPENYFQPGITQQSFFVHCDVFKKIGVFDPDYPVAADYEWLARAVKNKISFQYLGMPFATFKIGGVSTPKSRREFIKLEKEKRDII
ncbi:glycosyltransferase, partial [Patescibacteria group bacterium]|nr:glycosyltransferase [Patescibacteria group bacterium]